MRTDQISARVALVQFGSVTGWGDSSSGSGFSRFSVPVVGLGKGALGQRWERSVHVVRFPQTWFVNGFFFCQLELTLNSAGMMDPEHLQLRVSDFF